MAVTLILSAPILSGDLTHDSSDYQIATDATFADDSIVTESIGDTSNKLEKIFIINLDPNIKYYARGRLNFNKYTGEWSNITLLNPKDLASVSLQKDLPVNISTPIITINSLFSYIPNSMFTVNISDLITDGNGLLDYVDYFITDVRNNVYFTSLNNKDNLKSLLIDTSVLDTGKTYLLKVILNTTSGDSSDAGVLVFSINKNEDIDLISTTDLVEDTDIHISLTPNDNVVSINTKLYSVGMGEPELLYDEDDSVFEFSIDKALYNNSDEYLVGFTYKYSDDTYSEIKYYKLNLHRLT